MTTDTRLSDLLARWEDLQKQGGPVSSEDLCRDCPELREELERQIRSLDSMDHLLQTDRSGQTDSKPGQRSDGAAAPATVEDLHPGAEPVPGYPLLERLGKGGYGEVWKATAPGGFHVALKFIPWADKDGSQVEQRALTILKSLRHPNLLATFGSWQTASSLVIAMELADRTLEDRYREAFVAGLPGIPRDELLEYFREAAKGIDYLNEHRHLLEGKPGVAVQHRDIKPQNILLVGSGVKVADFGLVRLLEHTVTSHTGCMTPSYAAPEFFEGHTSSTSDQYSLAVTYCHLRGGRVPFNGSLAEIMSGHLRHAPDLRMLPESEQPAVARALAKDPTQRWPSCRAFVNAQLECSPAGAPSHAERPEPPKPKASPRRPPANFTLLPGAAAPGHAAASSADEADAVVVPRIKPTPRRRLRAAVSGAGWPTSPSPEWSRWQ